jgi:RND family efflux transporter MFP subunit
MTRKTIAGLLAVLGAVGLAYFGGVFQQGTPGPSAGPVASTPASPPPPARGIEATAPAVTVLKVAKSDFVETVLITGSVAARDEILIAPEIEGLQVQELKADEGDTVTKGQLLARLTTETLDAQMAQNAANIARAEAAIAVARSGIVQAEASVKETANAFERAKPLKQSGYVSGATYDQRESAAGTAQAKLLSARDSLTSAEADKAAYEAARRELTFKRGRAEIRSPVDGLISRRSARVGAVASAVSDAMFRIIARGEVELDAEVAESDVHKIREGQKALVAVTGLGEVTGTVRLVSGEVDRTTRLGKVRVFFGQNPGLRLGAFGRGTIETAKSRGIAVPPSAVIYTPTGATVQAVVDGHVVTRAVKTGLKTQTTLEITEGLSDGDVIVAKSGSFLRDGDAVRPILGETKLSGGVL